MRRTCLGQPTGARKEYESDVDPSQPSWAKPPSAGLKTLKDTQQIDQKRPLCKGNIWAETQGGASFETGRYTCSRWREQQVQKSWSRTESGEFETQKEIQCDWSESLVEDGSGEVAAGDRKQLKFYSNCSGLLRSLSLRVLACEWG